MKKIFIVLLSLFIIFLILFVNSPRGIKYSPSITIDKVSFTVDVAKTPQQQQKGLAIYNSLPSNRGMVFLFNQPDYYTFWMKDMKFPIDIIYIRQNKIVDIFKDVPLPASPLAPLPVLKPKKPADTVLEINAGLSEKYGFNIGDSVKMSLN